MAAFSIGYRKRPNPQLDQRRFIVGTSEPAPGEGLEIRVDESKFSDRLEFYAHLKQLLNHLRETRQPRFERP